MKNIKKIITITAMTMALGTSAFAESGFEFLLQVPFGMNVGIPKSTKGLRIDHEGNMPIGADVGIEAQIGYMFQVKENFAISALAELGYSWDLYCFDNNTDYKNYPVDFMGVNLSADIRYDIKCRIPFNSFKIGLIPKFNIGLGDKGTIAIGIGGGVKIPGSGKVKITTTGKASADVPLLGRQEISFNDERSFDIKRKDITDTFAPSVIGYLRVTLDYYLLFTDNIGMNFGFYVGGAFGPTVKNLGFVSTIVGIPDVENFLPNIELSKFGANAFEIGLQLGFRYGPKA